MAISESPASVQPVLDAVAQRAGLLCHADGARVWILRDGKLHAMTNYGPGYVDSPGETLAVRRTSIAGRALLDRRCVHVEDILPLLDTEYPDVRAIQARISFRTALNVPLLSVAPSSTLDETLTVLAPSTVMPEASAPGDI